MLKNGRVYYAPDAKNIAGVELDAGSIACPSAGIFDNVMVRRNQVANNTSLLGTPFTITVDKLGGKCTTGVSMYDRAETILALADPKTKPSDLGRPGHINPLRASSRGVLRRAGHTEAAVDLARLAVISAGALIEIINEDRTMARLPQLIEVAKKFDIKIICIKDLIAYRLRTESIVENGVVVDLPTEYGHFRLIPFRQKSNGLEHIALIKGKFEKDEPILVRVHSSCATGDIFGSMRCGETTTRLCRHRPRRQRGYRLPEPRRTRHRIDGEDESIQAPRGWFGYGGRELAFRPSSG